MHIKLGIACIWMREHSVAYYANAERPLNIYRQKISEQIVWLYHDSYVLELSQTDGQV
jgi:hypothetical protein